MAAASVIDGADHHIARGGVIAIMAKAVVVQAATCCLRNHHTMGSAGDPTLHSWASLATCFLKAWDGAETVPAKPWGFAD